jgi:hypothetical protein
VAVGGRLVEVGQRLLLPDADALGEGVEGGQGDAVSGGEERLQAPLGVGAIVRAVDTADRTAEWARSFVTCAARDSAMWSEVVRFSARSTGSSGYSTPY